MRWFPEPLHHLGTTWTTFASGIRISGSRPRDHPAVVRPALIYKDGPVIGPVPSVSGGLELIESDAAHNGGRPDRVSASDALASRKTAHVDKDAHGAGQLTGVRSSDCAGDIHLPLTAPDGPCGGREAAADATTIAI
jgi:hypothetical protein